MLSSNRIISSSLKVFGIFLTAGISQLRKRRRVCFMSINSGCGIRELIAWTRLKTISFTSKNGTNISNNVSQTPDVIVALNDMNCPSKLSGAADVFFGTLLCTSDKHIPYQELHWRRKGFLRFLMHETIKFVDCFHNYLNHLPYARCWNLLS